MNCIQARQHWELYHDSEGDGELYLVVNEHLATCRDCATWFTQQSAFEALLCERVAATSADPELWARLVTRAGVTEPAAHSRWFSWVPLLAMAASVIGVAVWWGASPSHVPEHLSAIAASLHARLEAGEQPIAFASTSDIDVEQYLKSRVGFPVRCPPRNDAGFSVRGGGVCMVGHGPAAYVAGRVGDGDVSVLILPATRLAGFAHEREVLATEAFHHCREGRYDMVLTQVDRNLVVVIGDATPADLERVARAYGTYPEPPRVSRGAPATLVHPSA